MIKAFLLLDLYAIINHSYFIINSSMQNLFLFCILVFLILHSQYKVRKIYMYIRIYLSSLNDKVLSVNSSAV